jgi:hypothetical protein
MSKSKKINALPGNVTSASLNVDDFVKVAFPMATV